MGCLNDKDLIKNSPTLVIWCSSQRRELLEPPRLTPEMLIFCHVHILRRGCSGCNTDCLAPDLLGSPFEPYFIAERVMGGSVHKNSA